MVDSVSLWSKSLYLR